ncbi:MAG: hypothetical protein H7A18_03295 [Sinobacteraceae bacterium]|nr:hypothetical protein [Nevskiaceae bacterium]
MAALEAALAARHGETQREPARRGIAQVAALWRDEDGDEQAFAQFVLDNFAGTQQDRDLLFARWQHNLEQIHGHAAEISRELNVPLHLDVGPVAPFDEWFAAWDPAAHWQEDFFASKLAFTVLLNFPLTTLEQKTVDGANWSRRQWAETLLAERFRERVPAAAAQAVASARAAADAYVARYNIWMHHLVDAGGQRLFPAGKRLLSHWNLRDELKANYAEGRQGLARQRSIQRVMERIVAQEIPLIVIDNPAVDWNPFSNAVTRSPVNDGPAGDPPSAGPTGPIDAAREPDTRYARLLQNFHAQRAVDRYAPTQPTYVQRVFEHGRQLSEARVQSMLEQVLGSEQVKRTARLIEKRLGRRLEPFDIWYSGFKAAGGRSESELDALVAARYPDAAAYERDVPRLLRRLGFAADRADYVAGLIKVDPARGSGHAMGAAKRGIPTRLRTRIEPGGMNYKGYNIAVHEMCHNVEQVFSLNDIEYWSLSGVPNTAFTEALAFTCQYRDLELLGLARPDPGARAARTLDALWTTYEIGGVALVDMRVWRWMYQHPQATPAELRQAVMDIAKEVWNQWYAPIFGVRDVTLLAIYSHMINEFLYLPDYPVGQMIAFQVAAQMDRAGDFGAEFERVARIGAVAPDLWMRQAAGAPVGPEALLAAAQEALLSAARNLPP